MKDIRKTVSRRLLAMLAIIVLVACVTNNTRLPPPEQLLMLDEGSTNPELENLRSGRSLAITECASCHRFYWPEEYSPEAWKEILRRMARLSSLSERQADHLTSYFLLASQACHNKEPIEK